MGNEHSDRGGDGLCGCRMRAVLPSAAVGGASLAGLEELMRTATQVKAQAESVRAGAAAGEGTQQETNHPPRHSRLSVAVNDSLLEG